MNLILLEPKQIDEHGRARLSGRRARHVREVIGAGLGEALRVGVVRGRRGVATITGVAADSVELEVVLDGAVATRPRVDVILALPRPKALLRALQTCASFGVGRIDLVNAWRVDKSYFHSRRIAPAALRDELIVGCEQGQHTWLPTCQVHKLLVPFARGALAERLEAEPDTRRVIAHPRASRYVEEAFEDLPGSRMLVAIGPERGWIDRELEMFEDMGFAPVRLGAPVLRTEAAIAALLAQLSLLARLESNELEPAQRGDG